MREGTRRRVGNLIRIGISAGLLIWLLHRYDFRGVVRYFADLNLSVWTTAFLMLMAAQVLSSVRWWILARTFSFPGRWPTYLGFYYVGMFFNLFLPTGIGGDLFKVHFLSREEGRRFLAAFTVVGDRLFGLIAMLILGGSAALVWPGLLPGPFTIFLAVSSLLIPAALAGLPLLQMLVRRIWPRAAHHLDGLLALWRRPWQLIFVLVLSFCLQGLGMGAVALLGRGIGIDMPFPFYMAVLPLVALMTLIPVSFSGIGVREGAFVYFFGLKGVGAEPAFGLGLLFFSLYVAMSLVGGIAYAVGVHRRSILERGPEETTS